LHAFCHRIIKAWKSQLEIIVVDLSSSSKINKKESLNQDLSEISKSQDLEREIILVKVVVVVKLIKKSISLRRLS
jgi:hypothetical protein